MAAKHEHTWAYKCLEYERGPLVDGLTHEWNRIYRDVYFCSSCLDETRKQTFIRNSTAAPVIANARPAPMGSWAEVTGEENLSEQTTG